MKRLSSLFPPILALLIPLQLFVLIGLQVKQIEISFSWSFSCVTILIADLIVAWSLSNVVELLIRPLPYGKWMGRWAFIVFEIVLFRYHRVTRVSLDPSALFSNLDVSSQSLAVALNYISSDWRTFILILGGAALGLEALSFYLRPLRFVRLPSIKLGLIGTAIWITWCVFSIPTHDGVTSFAQQSVRYAWQLYAPPTQTTVAFPFLRPDLGPLFRGKHPPKIERPSIVLIMIESFNGKYVGKTDSLGRAYTPHFNAIAKEGLSITPFYGNSIQTVKGHNATLCSLIPSYATSIVKTYPRLSLQCLPSILKKNGYRTLFYQAEDFRELNYGNELAFLERNGFDEVSSVHPLLTPLDRQTEYWGWGPSDEIFYTRVFDDIEKRDFGKQPVFLTLAPVNLHRDFDALPESKRRFFPSPKGYEENYINALAVSDQALETLIRRIRRSPVFHNAIILITADHSYPTGDHGITNNETGHYHESFAIPFALIWKNHIRPEHVQGMAYSQLDIAPTLLSLLGLWSLPHHFAGDPILGPDRKLIPKNSALLVQPYGGSYIGRVEYPWFYMQRLLDHREELFNLESDPQETHNLANTPSGRLMQHQMKKSLDSILTNESALRLDRIFPHETSR